MSLLWSEAEIEMFDIEKQKERFKDHVATFTDYGNIKVLDFQKPDRMEYRIRFIFEEDWYKLHISGDLGELTATNYHNMTWEEFDDFVDDPGYFESKVDANSRHIYLYDYDKAEAELKERFKDFDFSTYFSWGTSEENLEEAIEGILSDFDDIIGIGSKGYDALHEYDPDCWEYASDLGKYNTGILELYLLAFKLAKEQLEKKE